MPYDGLNAVSEFQELKNNNVLVEIVLHKNDHILNSGSSCSILTKQTKNSGVNIGLISSWLFGQLRDKSVLLSRTDRRQRKGLRGNERVSDSGGGKDVECLVHFLFLL